MRRFNKYLKTLSLGIQTAIEYRFNFLLGIVSIVFPLTIQYFLWTAIYSSSSGNNVYGYTFSQMITYSILAILVSKLVSSDFQWEVLDDIKNGGFNKFIIRPINYLLYRLFNFVGQKLFNFLMMFMIISVILTFLTINLNLGISLTTVFLFILSIFLAFFINFFIYYAVSAMTFWISDASGLFAVISIVGNIVSGGIFPLDIFSSTVKNIFSMLPFQYTIFFPVNIINGKFTLNQIAFGLLMQCLWIIILLISSKALWFLGMKKYTAIGG
ncbi:ABC transporter permease [Clostridium oryzae]|uniref:ABC-2 family transporter protein n=1 Tax=Clostridium oryzae TaxID=1450648 RepID=A0A1V4IMZ1_9CLOT|nr:ABC-2 family transporter protein [Clostridium oryzae]OPJ61194.1 ABC-2 family transporter protein [Clostridium oryzae]